MDSSRSFCPKFLFSPGRWSSGGFAFPKTSHPKVSGAPRGSGWAKQSAFTDSFPLTNVLHSVPGPLLVQEELQAQFFIRYLFNGVMVEKKKAIVY